MELINTLTLVSGCVAFGMVLGAWLYNRNLRKKLSAMAENNLRLFTKLNLLEKNNVLLREANQACYDQGHKDGKLACIKELGKAMLSESAILSN
jgi:hypothetical protein